MTYTAFDYAVADKVATVRLNQPERRNAMTLAFWQEIADVFAAIDADPGVRCAVLCSSGKHFTAGLDLMAFAGFAADAAKAERGRNAERLRRTVLEMQESFNAIERCRVPVLAAIQGGCIGGGVDMVTACDVRYATQDAFFRVHEINIGMAADVGTLQRLPKLIPAGAARELAYTGRDLPAARALELGLVTRLFVDQAAMEAEVQAIAGEIAAKSPLAVAGSKEMLNHARDHSVAEGLSYIAAWQSGMLLSDDLGEALAAQRDKRPAKFADLLAPRRIVRRRDP
ncbi:MAG: crotonase/enoyl-CoA hydratase family protein [Alphaproteobacteria bacterium]|nr:crotonase/enoyl-CoA hydratase family protein [Alphaproteobacteria bacterium]